MFPNFCKKKNNKLQKIMRFEWRESVLQTLSKTKTKLAMKVHKSFKIHS